MEGLEEGETEVVTEVEGVGGAEGDKREERVRVSEGEAEAVA
jgi:hypothetical protein